MDVIGGKRHGLRARALYIYTKSCNMAAILQKKLDLGRPPTCLILTIPLKLKKIVEVCRTLYIFFFMLKID